jgi:hypothetical protein
MAMDVVEINSYEYSLISPDEDTVAIITCRGGDHVIVLHFRGPAGPLPGPIKTVGPSGEPGKFLYLISFRHTDIANVIDMLRNEKPIYMKYNPDNTPPQARIATDPGPLI